MWALEQIAKFINSKKKKKSRDEDNKKILFFPQKQTYDLVTNLVLLVNV